MAVSSCAKGARALAPVLAMGRPAIAVPTPYTVELRDPRTLEPLPGWRPISVSGVQALRPVRDGGFLVTGAATAPSGSGTSAGARLRRARRCRGVILISWRQGRPGAGRSRRLLATRHARCAISATAALHDFPLPDQGRRALAGTGVPCCPHGIHSYSFDGEAGAILPYEVDLINAMALGEHGGRLLLAVAGTDNTDVRVLDARTGDALSPPLRQRIDTYCFALSFATLPTGPALVAAGAAAELVAWRLDGFARCELPGGFRYSSVRALAVGRGPNGDVLFAGGDELAIVAVDLSGLEATHRRVQAHRGSITALCVSGPHVVSGGDDGMIRVWDFRLEPRLEIALDAEVTSLAAHDGIVLAGTMAGVVALDLSHATATIEELPDDPTEQGVPAPGRR